MVIVRNLQETPTLKDFTQKVREKEKIIRHYEVSYYDFKLYPNDMLQILPKALKGKFPVSEQTISDLGRIADIPGPYLKRSDRQQRSVLFN